MVGCKDGGLCDKSVSLGGGEFAPKFDGGLMRVCSRV